MNRKVVAIATAMVLATSSMSSIALAAPSDSEISAKANEYKSAQEKLDQIDAEVRKLDNEISNLIVNIDETNNKIGQTEKSIKNATTNIKNTEKDMVEEEELFRQRMRSMYMNGMDTYVEVLLNSDGFSELVSRLENIKQIINYDKELMKELNDKKATIEKEKATLETKQKELVALKAENDKKMDELAQQKKSHEEKLDVAKKEKETLSAELDQLKTAKAAYDAEIAAQQRPSRGGETSESSNNSGSSSNGGNSNSNGGNSNSGGGSTVVPANPMGQDIVNYAYNFLGTPYLWGGTTPAGFDCSGFTQYVYAHFGISITRTTYTQVTQGTYVTRDNLAPGDLVFFTYGGGSVDHVGIYVGGGQYIHAPQTGDVVKVSTLGYGYMTARRII